MKRIILVLLYSNGSYMLSRNFRLQRVGDIEWVLKNYAIRQVSLGIDELMVIDVSRDKRDGLKEARFHHDVERLVDECFVPVTVGGHLRSLDAVNRCFSIGADKVLLRTAFIEDPALCSAIAARYGSQALVGCIDLIDDPRFGTPANGRYVALRYLDKHLPRLVGLGAGEVLLQSVDNDGTGMGLRTDFLKFIQPPVVPLILMGGVGHAQHIAQGLALADVDAVATANLFNFVGEALVDARAAVKQAGIELADWSTEDVERLRDILR